VEAEIKFNTLSASESFRQLKNSMHVLIHLYRCTIFYCKEFNYTLKNGTIVQCTLISCLSFSHFCHFCREGGLSCVIYSSRNSLEILAEPVKLGNEVRGLRSYTRSCLRT